MVEEGEHEMMMVLREVGMEMGTREGLRECGEADCWRWWLQQDSDTGNKGYGRFGGKDYLASGLDVMELSVRG